MLKEESFDHTPSVVETVDLSQDCLCAVECYCMIQKYRTFIPRLGDVWCCCNLQKHHVVFTILPPKWSFWEYWGLGLGM